MAGIAEKIQGSAGERRDLLAIPLERMMVNDHPRYKEASLPRFHFSTLKYAVCQKIDDKPQRVSIATLS